MSDITSLLKFAFSLFRTSAAKKLQDGDLTDEKVRGVIVKQLDNIEFKLDGLVRKDLCASESCLRQGIQHLIMSLDEPTESESSSTSELKKHRGQAQRTSQPDAWASSSKTKPTQTTAAFALADAVQMREVKSSARLESAKELFKEAEKKAREAFHNTGLSTEDRILASEIRIASGILKLLDDPELAVSDCLLYLQELHDMPAIKQIFSVENELGIKSWFKSNFNKDSRAEIVERVTTLNLVVAGFVSKFTKRRMAVLDWPMIECGTCHVHPIHGTCELPKLTKKLDITPPWDIENNDFEIHKALPFTRALKLNNYRFFYQCGSVGPHVILDKTTGKLQPYCRTEYRSDSEQSDEGKFHIEGSIVGVAVDEDGNAYVISYQKKHGYTLSIYSTENIQHFPINLRCGNLRHLAIAVTKNKHIVICQCCYDEDDDIFKIFLYNNSGEMINSFDTKQFKPSEYLLQFASVSCDDELIIGTSKGIRVSKESFVAFFFREDGQLQRIVKFRASGYRVIHNKVTKSFIVFHCTTKNVLLEYFSDQTGELQRSYVLYQTNMPKKVRSFHPVCHPNGALSLAGRVPGYYFCRD